MNRTIPPLPAKAFTACSRAKFIFTFYKGQCRYGLYGQGIEYRCPDRPWGPPSLLQNGYRVSLPGRKRPRRGADHPPPTGPSSHVLG
jgi:hypothetical protein